VPTTLETNAVTTLRPGRACKATAKTIVFLWLAVAGAAHAADQILVGVTSVRFAWSPASGQLTGYLVSRSVNGGAFQSFGTTVAPEITLPVAAGQTVAIRVAATGYDSAGVYRVGPQSATSDRVTVQAAPVFAATGSWMLRCASCNLVATRSLSNASAVLAQAPGLAAPWRVLGVAQLQYGRDQMIWHNSSTGKFAVYDGQFLAAITGLSNFGPPALRGVGAADLDGDGDEEFIAQRTDNGTVMVWSVHNGQFQNTGTIPGPAGGQLAAVKDFDRDGKIDLLWHNPTAGTLDFWRMLKDPSLPLGLDALLGRVVRVASGLASDTAMAAVGDFDGDGYNDVLWRYSDGRLAISYLVAGVPLRFGALWAAAGDADRRVIGAVDIGGTIGEEVALQDTVTGLITILDAAANGSTTRINVVHPGAEWRVVGIGW
jgi:hypothetical protein